MTITLRKNAVIESWGMIIEGGAGKEKRIMEETYQYLQQANIPDIRLRKDVVSLKIDTLCLEGICRQKFRHCSGASESWRAPACLM